MNPPSSGAVWECLTCHVASTDERCWMCGAHVAGNFTYIPTLLPGAALRFDGPEPKRSSEA